MNFDWSINLGHVIAVVGFMISGAGVVWALRADLKVLAQRVTSLETSFLKIADVLVHIGRQEERLNAHERRISRVEDDRRASEQDRRINDLENR